MQMQATNNNQNAVYHLSSANDFQTEVVEASKSIPVIVDMYADWCGPCKMLAPIIVELAEQYKDKVKFVKINTDELQDLASQYKVMSIPTIMVFIHGVLIFKEAGALPKEQMQQFVEEIIASWNEIQEFAKVNPGVDVRKMIEEEMNAIKLEEERDLKENIQSEDANSPNFEEDNTKKE